MAKDLTDTADPNERPDFRNPGGEVARRGIETLKNAAAGKLAGCEVNFAIQGPRELYERDTDNVGDCFERCGSSRFYVEACAVVRRWFPAEQSRCVDGCKPQPRAATMEEIFA